MIYYVTILLLQNALRFQKLIFFGTFLCSEIPSILQKKSVNGVIEFSNIVENKTSTVETDILLENDIKDLKTIKMIESECAKDIIAGSEVSKLLQRKDELERKQRMREKYNQRLQVSF